MSKKILIVEDDKKLREELAIFLKNNGYQTILIEEFSHVIQEMIETKCDLVLLDIHLPFQDGEMICKEVRKKSNVAIIMITSRDSQIDELISMRYGADDYITKPFHPQILLARMAAVLKRVSQEKESHLTLTIKDFELDLSESKLKKGEKEIELSRNEKKILQCLLSHKGKIVSREEMMAYLWNTDEFIDDNTLTVNMSRVKNKLEEFGLKDIIETKRGQGYRLG